MITEELTDWVLTKKKKELIVRQSWRNFITTYIAFPPYIQLIAENNTGREGHIKNCFFHQAVEEWDGMSKVSREQVFTTAA